MSSDKHLNHWVPYQPAGLCIFVSESDHEVANWCVVDLTEGIVSKEAPCKTRDHLVVSMHTVVNAASPYHQSKAYQWYECGIFGFLPNVVLSAKQVPESVIKTRCKAGMT